MSSLADRRWHDQGALRILALSMFLTITPAVAAGSSNFTSPYLGIELELPATWHVDSGDELKRARAAAASGALRPGAQSNLALPPPLAAMSRRSGRTPKPPSMNITVLPGNIAAERSPLQIAREFADGQLRLPGAALSDGPREVTISGRTAAFYEMTFGASPGSTTPVAGKSRVWVIAHNGVRLFMGARVPAPDVPDVAPELESIVGNLRLTDPTEFVDPARAALAWLELLDARQIAAAWVAADETFRNERSLQRWATDADKMSAAWGTPTSRGAPSASPTRGDDGNANSMRDQLVLRIDVVIDSGKRATEVLLMRRRPGTGWRVATYAIAPDQ